MRSRVLALVAACALAPARAATVVDHRIELAIDPARGHVRVDDRLQVPASLVRDGRVVVVLNAGLVLERVDGARREGAPARVHERFAEHVLRLEHPERRIRLHYAGVLRMPDARGRPGEWLDARGAHLGAASGWYPRFGGGELATFDLTVRAPTGWRALAPGGAAADTAGLAGHWVTDTPVDDVDVVAGAFERYERDGSWGRAMVWLREPDADLAGTYLAAVERYVPMYSALLGTYPFAKFAVVENLLQSGWGMPSFTLLGSRVMRLPFIPHTSLPHEIVHNWWGNGVLVDLAQGNWSEGLTAYLADHLLAEARGRGAVHRRDALARFRNHVREAGDAPPSRFVARHDEASQAVGYDKPMMIFHMLRRAQGDAAFARSLAAFYDGHRFERVGAAALLAALAPRGEDWFEAWWSRAGAPRLRLECCEVDGAPPAVRVAGRLIQAQPGEPFPIEVPVQVLLEGEQEAREHRVAMRTREVAFALELPARPRVLQADAGFDLMRVPQAAELPPSLGELLGAPRALASIPAHVPQALADAYRRMAAALGAEVVDPRAALPAAAIWIFDRANPHAAPWRDALETSIPHGDSQVLVARVDADPRRPVALVHAASVQAADALATRLRHYGRYGLLGFEGGSARNVFKGERAVVASPLRVVIDPGAAAVALPLPPRAPLASP